MTNIFRVEHFMQIQFFVTLNFSRQATHFIKIALFFLLLNHRLMMTKTRLLISCSHLNILNTFKRFAYLPELFFFQTLGSFLNINLFVSQINFYKFKLPQSSIHSLILRLTIFSHKHFVYFIILHLSITNQWFVYFIFQSFSFHNSDLLLRNSNLNSELKLLFLFLLLVMHVSNRL